MTFFRKSIQLISRFLSGHDAFISYARIDGESYARNLISKLLDKKLDCYWDGFGSSPGIKIPRGLINRIKKSTALVLVGTQQSYTSKAVLLEIETYLATCEELGKEVLITPIEVHPGLNNAIWWPLINGIARSTDDESGPKDHVIERIHESIKLRSRAKRIRNLLFGGIAFLALLGILAFYFAGKNKDLVLLNSNLGNALTEKNAEISAVNAQLNVTEKTIESNKRNLKLLGDSIEDAETKNKGLENALSKGQQQLNRLNTSIRSNK
ncbi:MAG: toll/interleukin-1 receptor domain-containing protein, partial [Bacteroidota bacterium]